MRNKTNYGTIQELQTAVGGVKDILTSKKDLNEEKECLIKMIEQVNFLVGQHDSYCEHLDAMFTAMINFDFSKRITTYEEDDNNMVNVVSQGLNMLNEEFYEKAINKNIVKTLLYTLAYNKTVIVTNNKNIIIFAAGKQLPGFSEEELRGKSIGEYFNQHELIIHLMKAENLTSNINLNMSWHGTKISVSLKIALSMNLNVMEGIIYIIDIPKEKI